mmetsp:Transcript_13831/g.20192  ORF Transcript_13831/g.20192 Transcript_13831/m.20192 type:complete len:201 (-) Transcript_13831:48-650(-)
MLFLPTLKTVGITDMERVNSIMGENADEQAVLRAAKLAELKTARNKKVKERVLAMLFMQNVDRSRYGKKYEEIDEASELGRDEFPTTLTQAFHIFVMQEYRVIERHQRSRYQEGRHGFAFAQGGGRTGGEDRENGSGNGNGGGTDTHYDNGRPRRCPEGEEPVAGVNGNIMRDYLCFGCNRYGHTRHFCLEARVNGGPNE